MIRRFSKASDTARYTHMMTYRILMVIWGLLAGSAALADGPARWQLADDDTTITLLGSVHVLKPGTDWLEGDLKTVVDAADIMVFELSPEQQSPGVLQPLIQRHGFLPEGQSLQSVLPEDLYRETFQAFAEIGVPASTLQSFRPWFAGVNYALLKFARLGYNPASGVEETLKAIGQQRGMPMGGLEGAADQIGIFGALTLEEEIDFLRSGLEERGEIAEVMARLTASWTAGDIADLDAYFADAFVANPALEDRLLAQRNQNWVSEIAALLDTPGNILVVMGTGHLVGDASVLVYLRRAGFTPRRVN